MAQRNLRFTESGSSSRSSSHSMAEANRSLERSQLTYDYEYDHLFKLLICGDCSVGKTSVMNRFVSNKFRVAHIRTLGEFYHSRSKIYGFMLRGSKYFITEQAYRRVTGFNKICTN